MLYRFTGTDVETFPTIVTADGVLVASPGDLVELDHDPGHPRLVPIDGTDPDAAAGTAAHVEDVTPGPHRPPAPEDAPAPEHVPAPAPEHVDAPAPARRRHAQVADDVK